MNQEIENAKAQMRKGVLELCVLTVLSRGDAYANDLINQLKQAKMIVVEGTIYPLLTRQKNAGLLTYRSVSYTHLRAHETVLDLVCRLLLEKKKQKTNKNVASTN